MPWSSVRLVRAADGEVVKSCPAVVFRKSTHLGRSTSRDLYRLLLVPDNSAGRRQDNGARHLPYPFAERAPNMPPMIAPAPAPEPLRVGCRYRATT